VDGSSSRSEAVTRSVRVLVEARHLAERSQPEEGQWIFAYTVRLTNEGSEPVRLRSRHWIITDADGRVEEVQGPGVVGQQPLLAAGASFEYTSFCPLGTPFGTMHGTYQMEDQGGETFDVEIAPFTLALPFGVN
jgi:ApaG protein